MLWKHDGPRVTMDSCKAAITSSVERIHSFTQEDAVISIGIIILMKDARRDYDAMHRRPQKKQFSPSGR